MIEKMVTLTDGESTRMASFYENGFAPMVEVDIGVVINNCGGDNIFFEFMPFFGTDEVDTQWH